MNSYISPWVLRTNSSLYNLAHAPISFVNRSMNLIKTFNHNEKEYVHFINVLTDAIRNCPETRGTSLLTGDTIMLTPFHQLTIEQTGVNGWSNWGTINYRIFLNRIVDGGVEYLIVDDGSSRESRPAAIEAALEEFYEELAFYAPDERTVETMDITDTLENLFRTYQGFINASYSSSFA